MGGTGYGGPGADAIVPSYVVTNLQGDGQALYDKLYCARGEMKNRIKEQQLDLFADRTSCHRWWPNQFRLLLSSLGYMLLEAIRRLALKGTALANTYVGTQRLKLLKVGAVILRIPDVSASCYRVLTPTSDCSSTLQPGGLPP